MTKALFSEHFHMKVLTAFLLQVVYCCAVSVKKSHPDQLLQLPGLNYQINFKLYNGYLKVGEDIFLHYFFVESQRSPAQDPVLLWLNGGPGCSSLAGLFGELGPFFIKKDGVTLYENPYAWNKVANIIFFESPPGVGFSYSASNQYKTSDDQTADINYNALQSFFQRFPQFQENEFFVTGESYSGVYIPTLCVRILHGNSKINFKGFAIGNGVLNVHLKAKSLIFFGYYHGLIGVSDWESLTKVCCNGVPSKNNCHFSETNSSPLCTNEATRVTKLIHSRKINIYNIYDSCYQFAIRKERYFLDMVSVFGLDELLSMQMEMGMTDQQERIQYKETGADNADINRNNENKQIITGTERIKGKAYPENAPVKSEPQMDQINKEIRQPQEQQEIKSIPDPQKQTLNNGDNADLQQNNKNKQIITGTERITEKAHPKNVQQVESESKMDPFNKEIRQHQDQEIKNIPVSQNQIRNNVDNADIIPQNNQNKQIITGTERIMGKAHPANVQVESQPKMDPINKEIRQHQQEKTNIPNPQNQTRNNADKADNTDIPQNNQNKQIVTGTEKIAGKAHPENLQVKSEPKIDQINKEIRQHQDQQEIKNIPDPQNQTRKNPVPSVDDLKPTPICTDSVNTTYYMNQNSLREALRIPKGLPKWTACNHELHPLYTKQYESMHAHFLELLNSGRVRGLVYHGDVDSVCNYLGNEWFVDSLGIPVLEEHEPWFYDHQIAGFVKYYRNLTYMTVKGSGHMVPKDKPGPALSMLSSFLKNEPF